jgi:hypothetical protein
MKELTAILLLTSSLFSFSQDKIPVTDFYNPPKSVPKISVSTVEETATPAAALKANGCTQNFSNTRGLFIQDEKRFKSMTPLEKDFDKQIVKQTVVTGSQTEIRFTMSNCTHKMIVINLVPKKIQSALPHHVFRQALTLLSSIQADREQKEEIYPLKKALARNNWQEIKNENDLFILPCKDAKCTLKVIKVDGVDKEIQLTLDYNS